MKILQVISSVNPLGGGPIEGVRQTGCALAELGHSTEIACCDPPNSEWLSGAELPIHALGPGRGTYCFAPDLKRWLNANADGFDAVVVNGLWQYHGLATFQTMRTLRRPYVVFAHGMLGPWFKERYPLKHLKKVLYWLAVERHVLSKAAAVLFTCQEEMLQARGSFHPYRVRERVAGLGTSPPTGHKKMQMGEFISHFPQLRNKRILLFLSRIHPVKGCDLLIRAFAELAAESPDAYLVIAGPDPQGWQKQLEALADTLGITGRIIWPGLLSGDLKWGAFHACETFILPSHHENFGIVVAEALACGKPVLISDKVNIWREIEADGAGLVADDTEDGIKGMLERWLRLSGDERSKMGSSARVCFGRHFDISQSARSLLDALEALPR